MRILPSVTALCLGALLRGTTPSPGWASGIAELTEAEIEGQIPRVTLYLDSKIDLKKIILPNEIDVIGKGAGA
ncbi:MAG: hypothetical protein ABGZ37_14525 [Akkermansiaceae bacterium]